MLYKHITHGEKIDDAIVIRKAKCCMWCKYGEFWQPGAIECKLHNYSQNILVAENCVCDDFEKEED